MIHALVVSVEGTINSLKGKALTGGGQQFNFTSHGYRAVESVVEGPLLPEKANRRMFRKPKEEDKIVLIPGTNGCAARWTFSEVWRRKCDAFNETL